MFVALLMDAFTALTLDKMNSLLLSENVELIISKIALQSCVYIIHYQISLAFANRFCHCLVSVLRGNYVDLTH